MSKRTEAATKAARARWDKTTPEQRSAQMSRVATRPRVNAEDLELLAWLRENRAEVQAVLTAWKSAREILDAETLGTGWVRPELAYLSEQTKTLGDAALAESNEMLRRASDLTGEQLRAAGYTIPHPIAESLHQVAVGVAEVLELEADTRPVLDTCAICQSPLYDLDARCPKCLEAGRLAAVPPTGHGADIAEFQRAHDAAPNPDSDGSMFRNVNNAIERERVRAAEPAVPTISNARPRGPIPPPLPPLRTYTAAETCRDCGRLPELHEDRGGPIGHTFAAQVVNP